MEYTEIYRAVPALFISNSERQGVAVEKWKMVRSFQEYKELLGKWRELYDHNNGLYPSEIQSYIKKEKCFYRQFHWGILLLFDEDAYYQGAVYLKKNWQGSLDGERLSVPGDVLCNLVGKEEDENRQRLGKHLLSMGFSCILRNREYRIAPRFHSRTAGESGSAADSRSICGKSSGSGNGACPGMCWEI